MGTSDITSLVDKSCFVWMLVCVDDEDVNSTYVGDGINLLVDMYCFGLVVFCKDDEEANSTSVDA